jgi:hypothetical protein
VLKERYRRALEYMEWFQPAWDALTEDEQFVLSEFYCGGDAAADRRGRELSASGSYRALDAYNKKNRALARLALLLYGK